MSGRPRTTSFAEGNKPPANPPLGGVKISSTTKKRKNTMLVLVVGGAAATDRLVETSRHFVFVGPAFDRIKLNRLLCRGKISMRLVTKRGGGLLH
ncbi:hypothetical protein M0802_014074 [Mischocyttarus mexicanus]|nr:hypothetical protein M0802_014077 [Mischocyttarus mexicanus]KAI4480989.1 hypothetical protein M0802_014074 [Mischocyttarus mexicanus]